MIKFFKLLFIRKKKVDILTRYVKGLREELELYKNGYASYVTIPVPSGETMVSFNEYLGTLGKNQFFLFYLTTLENELLGLFRDGKGEDIYRGGLRAVDRIRKDIALANSTDGIKNRYE